MAAGGAMTFTVNDAHSAERVILVGCDDAVIAPYAQTLRLTSFQPDQWVPITKKWLADHVIFDTVSLSLFVEPHLAPAFASSGLKDLVADHYAQARINTNTVCAHNERQGINVVKNLKRIADGNGQDALRALPSMVGQTAVVCGAGPSLDDCYEALNRHEGPIVCVNTSAAAVLSFDPHVIVCSESKELNEWKRAVEESKPWPEPTRPIPVAMDLMSHPTHPEGIGPALYFASADPSLAPTARALGMQPIGYGPSCTTAAVSLCLALGAEKVLLVGQDCAFDVRDTKRLSTLGVGVEMETLKCRMYASGTPYESTVVRIDGLTGRGTIDKPTKGLQEFDAIKVEGIDGLPMWTMPSMLSFAHWFRDQPESVRSRVVNCSSHGVRIEGIEHKPLSECVQVGNAYDGDVQQQEGSAFQQQACEAISNLAYKLNPIKRCIDGELVELAPTVPLLNYWTNPAKLRNKLQNPRFDPYSYGKAIASAVRKAWAEIQEVLG
jgi:hypothetical protein